MDENPPQNYKSPYFYDLTLSRETFAEKIRSLKILPRVYAAKVEEPKKPEPMRPKDLPLYDDPHRKYNEHCRKKSICGDPKSPGILQEALLPTVTSIRCKVQNALKRRIEKTRESIRTAKCKADDAVNSTIKHLRDEKNYNLRVGLIGIGVLAGYGFAYRNGNIIKIINIAIAAGAMGALCFPCETDDIFRKSLLIGKDALGAVYGVIAGEPLYKEIPKDPCTVLPPDNKKC